VFGAVRRPRGDDPTLGLAQRLWGAHRASFPSSAIASTTRVIRLPASGVMAQRSSVWLGSGVLARARLARGQLRRRGPGQVVGCNACYADEISQDLRLPRAPAIAPPGPTRRLLPPATANAAGGSYGGKPRNACTRPTAVRDPAAISSKIPQRFAGPASDARFCRSISAR
jgi:hypothetical protein